MNTSNYDLKGELQAQAQLQPTRDSGVKLTKDMYPAQITSEKNLQREILSLLIRATGDDIGSRQKMQGGIVTTNTSSSLFVATAELLIPCSESDLWRIVVLNIHKDDVDTDVLTWLQKHPDVLRFYSRLFVQLFTLNDSRVAKLYEDYITIRTNLRDRKPELPARLVSNCAWLKAAIRAIVFPTNCLPHDGHHQGSRQSLRAGSLPCPAALQRRQSKAHPLRQTHPHSAAKFTGLPGGRGPRCNTPEAQ